MQGDHQGDHVTGPHLPINATVLAGGSIRVEVLDSSGTRLPVSSQSQAVASGGEQLDAAASWSGGSSLTSLAAQQAKLRLCLDDADLYSYWFTE